MNPLYMKILIGHADNELDRIISDLEAMSRNSKLSEGEKEILAAAQMRLEQITRPK